MSKTIYQRWKKILQEVKIPLVYGPVYSSGFQLGGHDPHGIVCPFSMGCESF